MKKAGILFFFLLWSVVGKAQELVNYTSISDLQANAGSRNRLAIIASGSNAGLYYWDATNTTTGDNINIIQVTGLTTGRWVISSISPTVVVSSFASAKTLVLIGVLRRFLITTNELYGAPTQSIFDGTNWYHSPALLQNN